MKTCTKCKNEFPETKEYFLLKPKSKRIKTNVIFRARCKKCFYKKTSENRIKRRCKEEGIEIHEWNSFIRNQLMSREMFQFKDKRLKNIPRPVRARILRKIREENYVFTNYEDYKKHCSMNISMAQRKYNLNYNGFLNSKIISETMPDYYIANRMKIPLKELSKEIIETKRLTIELKRQIR